MPSRLPFSGSLCSFFWGTVPAANSLECFLKNQSQRSNTTWLQWQKCFSGVVIHCGWQFFLWTESATTEKIPPEMKVAPRYRVSKKTEFYWIEHFQICHKYYKYFFPTWSWISKRSMVKLSFFETPCINCWHCWHCWHGVHCRHGLHCWHGLHFWQGAEGADGSWLGLRGLPGA